MTTETQQSRSMMNSGNWRRGANITRGLGWFSIGLGLTQILAPRVLAHWIGLRDNLGRRVLMRALGVRELTAGIGILSRSRPDAWLWARVAGDAMDLALLGSAFKRSRVNRKRLTFATASVIGVTALDLLDAQRHSKKSVGTRFRRGTFAQPIHVTQWISVNRSPAEVYGMWRNFENLPRFMDHLDSVEVIDEVRSRWRAIPLGGLTLEWDAEITEDRPNELIAWRALEGGQLPNWGSVRFEPAPGGRGTEVRLELQYEPPGGVVGKAFAKLFGALPAHQVGEDLRKFKQAVETGDIVRSDASVFPGMHPAQPEGGSR